MPNALHGSQPPFTGRNRTTLHDCWKSQVVKTVPRTSNSSPGLCAQCRKAVRAVLVRSMRMLVSVVQHQIQQANGHSGQPSATMTQAVVYTHTGGTYIHCTHTTHTAMPHHTHIAPLAHRIRQLAANAVHYVNLTVHINCRAASCCLIST